MRYDFAKSLLRTVAIAIPALCAGGVALAQTTVNLTAARTTASLPDGAKVPMWSYCQPTATGVLPAVLCPTDGTGTWTPGPTITVPTDSTGFGALTINLSNYLPVPTSIVILGQIGTQTGNDGSTSDVPRTAFPTHTGQPAITWPSVDSSASFTPPQNQAARAVAFAAETGAGTPTTATTMTYTWGKLRPGTYLYETGSLPSLQAPMGLYGIVVVTSAPVATTTSAPGVAGDAYPLASAAAPRAPYDADATLLFSEIDPRQNTLVDAAAVAGTSVKILFSDSACASPSNLTGKPCYPPVVNYAPTYFLINGNAFDPTKPAASGIALSGNSAVSGHVLLRMANASLRTHVPSVVGLSMGLVAEDGNFAPGATKRQSHLLMPAGKTYDIWVEPKQTVAGTYDTASFPVFDRSLSLTSGNLDHQNVLSNSGMMGFLAVQPAGQTVGVGMGATVPMALTAHVTNDIFATPKNTAFNGNVLSNDVNVATAAPAGTIATLHGSVVLGADGSFAYTPNTDYIGPDSFTYMGNGVAALTATVSITVGTLSAPIAVNDAFASSVASVFKSGAPGVLANDTLADKTTTVGLTAVIVDKSSTCQSVDLNADGSFVAIPSSVPAKTAVTCSFKYQAVNELGAKSTPATATITFNVGSGLVLTVHDSQDGSSLPGDDYSWVIEEDTTFFHDPTKPTATDTLATNFHKSYMPVVASGCTGPKSCGDDNSFSGTAIAPRARSYPKDVKLVSTKRYYVSVLPGDADQGDASYDVNGVAQVNAFGHTMGGVSIPAGQLAATVLVPRNPLPPSQLSVIVFEDNNPTNGGVDDNEQGLGGFTINLFDTRGSSGDPAGQMTYDLSAMPFTNSLANQKDSATGVNLCPMNTPSGTIITCPELDSNRQPSPLAGMALVKNINPGRYDVWAHPGADRAVKGEKWIQVSTLEGTPANDTFIKAGEPSYWQEFGPPGFHSFIGFINPDHIAAVTKAQGGKATVTGRVPSLHMDRPRPTMANLNNSCATGTNPDGTPINPADPSCRATLAATICYVAVNSNGGAGGNPTVAMGRCDDNGNFSIPNVPAGQQELVIWDQWLDQIIAYKALTVPPNATKVVAGDIPVFSWFTRVEQSAFQDLNGNGVRDAGEPGVSQIPMNIRFRDGSISNFLTTDSSGSVTANELFPLFNWYVLEADTTRYTGTGVMTAYDAGGKPDKAATSVMDLNGVARAKDFSGVLNSTEPYPLPANLQIGDSKYTPKSTVRIDSGATLTEGAQGFINQTAVVDWGKRPYVAGENGGITGMVYYASTRGFDDPSLEVQFSWEPGVAGVPVNLYQEVKQPDGSVRRVLVDQTTTWSWDASTATMHCPGEPTTGDTFVDNTLKGNNTKCYDGQHAFNQIQPALYDGRYRFPSAACSVPGAKFVATNGQTVQCATIANPANTGGLPNKPKSVTYPAVLPNGNYVVELQVPGGYEIVKEEDKNILIGDSFVAPFANTQFMGVGNVFIVPDQATLNDANVPGGNLASAFPPCVGTPHLVPDYLTLFPANQQLSPYAGQLRPLCDHKEVGVTDQGQGGADFQLFTQAPIAGHISGIMLNDAAAEFDPNSPAFLEKASLPNAPISVRDYNGVEIARVYNDRYGTFNNLVPSTWEANIPNPSGYAPNMLTFCMNDPGPIPDPSGAIDPKTGKARLIVDPLYNPMFSNFCYNWPSMPGITTYLDTPVLPVSAFASASSYEPVDCAYPDTTPGIYRVDGTNSVGPGNIGPVVDLAKGRSLTITALGDVLVSNPAYEGPNAIADTAHPTANQPKILRHYRFGATQGSGTVKVGNLKLNITSWGDTTIVASVPSGTSSLVGELQVTTGAGLKSIDTVTVTIGSNIKAAYVTPPVPGTATSTGLAHPIQDAIDAAKPGDLIILDAGNYSELVVMDRPVRLQGVGAAAVVINATKYPNQKVDQWRTRVNNLFGLDNQGNTLPGTPAVDPLPGQEITGGVVLLEPSVLSTEEGAGITVLAKGYQADGTTLLTSKDCGTKVLHNFRCANARIDGLSVTGGDAGGGIYVNGWAHNLEIANNRVYGNAGPFSGGIRVGQPYLEGQALPAQGSFAGFKYDENVSLHNNAITNNGTVEGNAAAGATAAAAGGAGGGLSICAGSDGYKVTGNWICGNFTSSDGGGIGHIGLSTGGVISGNKILFNESYNQSGPQYGGGLVIEGEGATGTTLSLGTGNVTVDSNLILGNFARAGSGGGIRLQSVNGADATVNSQRWKVTIQNNMIVNNMAAWAGAGISLADTLYSTIVNNTIAANDSTGIAGNLFNTQIGTGNTGPTTALPSPAGIASELTSTALLNSLPSNQQSANRASIPTIKNDIIYRNRSFFFTMDGTTPRLSPSNKWSDALLATKPALPTTLDPNGCSVGTGASNDKYWDLGVVGDISAATPGVTSAETLNVLYATQAGGGFGGGGRTVTVTTATPHNLPDGTTVVIGGVTGGTATNRARYTGSFVITVVDATSFTYQPTGGGVNNNTFAGFVFTAATVMYTPTGNPVLTTDHSLTSASPASPNLVKVYCNASRTLPGLQFEPGTPFQPQFTISVAATLDESGNFVDLHFGPLSLMDQATGTSVNGDYHLAGKPSSAIDTGTANGAPSLDYDGQSRPAGAGYDIGADEFSAAAAQPPGLPTLAVLDDFNRANANTLGGSWQQLTVLNAAGIRVNSPGGGTGGGTAQCNGLLCAAGAYAYWKTPAYGAKQGAALTFANTPVDGVALLLEASGTYNNLGYYPTAIRVRYATGGGGQVVVETTTNGLTYTSRGSFAANFASGDTLTALVDASGTVFVWQTSNGTTTFLGQAASTLTVAGGYIGLSLPASARVDNFSGGTVP